MKHLKPLVMMQLKDKIDFSFLKSKGKAISKIVFSVLGFVAVAAVCYLLFYASSLLGLFSFLPMIPITVIVVIFSVMFFLSCITSSFGLMKTMYMSNDNQVLLTMPVKPNMVFVSKLIVYYIYELIKNCYFILPLFVAYGIFSGFSLLFYPWLIISYLFISALPVLIGAIISIPLMYVTAWLKQTNFLRISLYVIALGAAVWGIVTLINLIPADINLIKSWGSIYWDIQDFLNNFYYTFEPLSLLVSLICGRYVNLHWQLFSIRTLWILLALIGVILVLFLFVFLISRPLFFKMASKPFEYKKKNITKTFKNRKRKTFLSSLTKELKTSFRRPEFIYNYLTVLIVLPIAILLLNKIFNAMNTRLLGTYMTFSFNILMILLILLATNAIIASIYSSEGRTAYLMKTVPHEYKKFLFPKLVVSIVLSSISTLVTVLIFNSFAKVGALNTLLMYLGILGLYIGHLFWSAELDLMNPQNEQYATTGSSNSNPNEKKSTILAFIISAIVFALSLFFFMEDLTWAWIKIGLFGVIFAVARVYFYFTRIKVYYGEK